MRYKALIYFSATALVYCATAQVSFANNQAGPVANTAPRLVIETGTLNSAIRAVTFTSNGEYVAASCDSDIRVWHVPTGQLYHTIRGYSSKQSGKITSLACDPNDQYLAIAVTTSEGAYLRTCALDNLDETAGYWGDPATVKDEELPGINLGARTASELTFSADGKYLAFIATVKNADLQNGRISDQPIYMIFDWETDEIHYHSAFNGEGTSGGVAGAKLFGVTRYQEAGRFFGSKRHYVMPNIGQIFDVAAQQQVGIDSDPDLAWFSGFLTRAQNYYGNDPNLLGYFDGDIANRVMVYAYMTKKDGIDIYRCDIWRDGDAAPRATYEQLGWAPSDLKVAPDGESACVGDTFGDVHVFSTRDARQLLRTRSPVRALYAASLDQKSGVIGMGQKPHRGSAWKRNDYADLDRGFDLRKRRFVDNPQGDFPRPKTKIDIAGITTDVDSSDGGFFVRVKQNSNQLFNAEPIPKPLHTWNLGDGFQSGEALVYTGGAGYLTANLVQLGAVRERFATTLRGFMVSQGSPEKTAVATDINNSADGRFVTAAWTDGSVCIYQKTDFEPQPVAILPFAVQSDAIDKMVVSNLVDRQACGDLQVGDAITNINGKSIATALQDIFTQAERNFPGRVMTATLNRGGKTLQVPFKMIKATNMGFIPSVASPVLTFISSESGEWILFTPEGYYDASLGGHDLIGWKVNRGPDETAQFFSAKQLRSSLYRPDVIDAVIDVVIGKAGNASVETAVSIASSNPALVTPIAAPRIDMREAQSLSTILPPEIADVKGIPEGGSTDGESITITVTAKSQNNLPVRNIAILVNGRPPGGRTNPEPIAGGLTLTRKIDLDRGDNEIFIQAVNSAGESTPRTFSVLRRSDAPQVDGPKPKLVLLSIGVADYKIDDYDLDYAAIDASSFAAAFKSQQGKMYSQVTTKVLTDADADRNSILKSMNWLRKEVSKDDVAVLFMSGHGVFDSFNEYYFCNYDVNVGDYDELRITGVPHTEIVRTLKTLPCKVLYFADTCHSAASAGSLSPFVDLVSEEGGTIVFASSLPKEESLESDEWGHGAFTKAILDAFKARRADDNGDGVLDFNEFSGFVEERVSVLTMDQQNPVSQKPLTIPNLPIVTAGNQ